MRHIASRVILYIYLAWWSTLLTLTLHEKNAAKAAIDLRTTRHSDSSTHQKSSPAAAALIHSCVLSAEVVLKLVKPFAHTNNPPEAP